MIAFRGAYIAGKFIRPKQGRLSLVKRDPGNTDEVIGRWCRTLNAVDDAVEAARTAYSTWAWEKASVRATALRKLQGIFKQRREMLATRISSEVGKTLAESRSEVDAAIQKFDIILQEALSLVKTHKVNGGQQYYTYHPQGVLAILGPFNFPLHLPNGNWVAALATGNTVVFKPSELTPFTAQLIAECFHEAGFPKGVFNLVQGGMRVGEKLVRHPDVDGIVFVGSDSTGRAIQKAAAKQPHKICVLEMGGKNAAVILKDAKLEQAIEACATSALTTTGQRCNALSRVIIHEDLVTPFTVKLAERALSWPVGHYSDAGARMGPLVSKQARERYLRYQEMAEREGGRQILAGQAIHLKLPGYYVSPAIHRMEWRMESRMESDAAKAKQKGYRYDEIFGPDIAIYTFRDLEEAIQIHNDSRYGLVASVFTKDAKQFETMLRQLEVGNLYWNRPTIASSSRLPFGGIKASGNHFPAGFFSPLFCTYPIAVQK